MLTEESFIDFFYGSPSCVLYDSNPFEPIVHGWRSARSSAARQRKSTALKSVFHAGTGPTIGLTARDYPFTFEGADCVHCACLFVSGLPAVFD